MHLRKSAKQVAATEKKDIEMSKSCILYLVERQLEGQKKDHKWECEIDADDNDGVQGRLVELNVNFPIDFKDEDVGSLESGVTTLHSIDAFVSGNKAIVRGKPKFSKKEKRKNDVRRLASTGKRSVLVVRVEANDSSTTASEEELAREVFGITDAQGNSDSFNLSKAYKQCSNNQLEFKPTTQIQTANGVYTVVLEENVTGQNEVNIRVRVLETLQEVFGSDLNSKFDHVMLCLPPGTHGTWKAYAVVNGYLSVYNDDR